MTLHELIDTIAFDNGTTTAEQSCLVPPSLAAAEYAWLSGFGEGYAAFLAGLPLLTVIRRQGGGHNVAFAVAPRSVQLLSFAGPYLTAASGGRELRYPIVGGLMARAPGGHLAFGAAPVDTSMRVWIRVHAFRPRLGLGPAYLLSQAQLHRHITIAYLRRALQAQARRE